mmetsp:Transcript_18275/g.31262  ORF Transcript_18275/g.31262 Transcript_18275/m.31262 type:complete len:107 (+) Transcript_18275:162-482(+)
MSAHQNGMGSYSNQPEGAKLPKGQLHQSREVEKEMKRLMSGGATQSQEFKNESMNSYQKGLNISQNQSPSRRFLTEVAGNGFSGSNPPNHYGAGKKYTLSDPLNRN